MEIQPIRENAMSNHGSEIGLADFLDSFRGELAEAIERAANEKLQLKASKIDLELQLTAERSGGPNAKIEFKVPAVVDASLGGTAQLSNKTTHVVKLSLTPILYGAGTTVNLFTEGERRPSFRIGNLLRRTGPNHPA
jgi:Trypsin-co-occurring domain 2